MKTTERGSKFLRQTQLKRGITSRSSVNRCWTAVLCDDDGASGRGRSICCPAGSALSRSDRCWSISTSWSSWWIPRRRIPAFRLTNTWEQKKGSVQARHRMHRAHGDPIPDILIAVFVWSRCVSARERERERDSRKFTIDTRGTARRASPAIRAQDILPSPLTVFLSNYTVPRCVSMVKKEKRARKKLRSDLTVAFNLTRIRRVRLINNRFALLRRVLNRPTVASRARARARARLIRYTRNHILLAQLIGILCRRVTRFELLER